MDAPDELKLLLFRGTGEQYALDMSSNCINGPSSKSRNSGVMQSTRKTICAQNS
jgi:hypothetical protein